MSTISVLEKGRSGIGMSASRSDAIKTFELLVPYLSDEKLDQGVAVVAAYKESRGLMADHRLFCHCGAVISIGYKCSDCHGPRHRRKLRAGYTYAGKD